MADERKDEWLRPDVKQDRKVTKWALILPAAALGSLAAGLVIFNAMYGRPNYTVGLYDTSRPVAEVTFREAAYKPSGPPVKIDDKRMVSVDYTMEGMMVYVPTADLEGGGGGRPERGAEPTEYSQLYLRTRDGLYQPLIRTR
jgi:hypothetical protein